MFGWFTGFFAAFNMNSDPKIASINTATESSLMAVDEPVDLSDYRWEDWITVVFFWVLGLVVFYQFFTRYALDNSAAWTEEIARYLLIIVTFVGGAMATRKNTHIHLEFL